MKMTMLVRAVQNIVTLEYFFVDGEGQDIIDHRSNADHHRAMLLCDHFNSQKIIVIIIIKTSFERQKKIILELALIQMAASGKRLGSTWSYARYHSFPDTRVDQVTNYIWGLC